MGIKPNFIQNEPLSVFEVLTYENAKTHAKRSFWRNRITLPKRYILSSFELVTRKKNAKIDGKHSILGKKSKLRETCIKGVL